MQQGRNGSRVGGSENISCHDGRMRLPGLGMEAKWKRMGESQLGKPQHKHRERKEVEVDGRAAVRD